MLNMSTPCDANRYILTLLEELSEPRSPVKELLGGGIKIRTELGESSNLNTRY